MQWLRKLVRWIGVINNNKSSFLFISVSYSHAATSKRSRSCSLTAAHRRLNKAPTGRATAKNKVKGLLSWWCLLIDWSVNNAVREEKVSAVSNGAASVLLSRSRVKRQGHETLMESAGRVGPRAPDMHQLHTTDRSLKRIRANEHEAPLSAAQNRAEQPCGYSDNQSLQGGKFDLRSEVNSDSGRSLESKQMYKSRWISIYYRSCGHFEILRVAFRRKKKDHAEHPKR